MNGAAARIAGMYRNEFPSTNEKLILGKYFGLSKGDSLY